MSQNETNAAFVSQQFPSHRLVGEKISWLGDINMLWVRQISFIVAWQMRHPIVTSFLMEATWIQTPALVAHSKWKQNSCKERHNQLTRHKMKLSKGACMMNCSPLLLSVILNGYSYFVARIVVLKFLLSLAVLH